jgi:hypothetical protein
MFELRGFEEGWGIRRSQVAYIDRGRSRDAMLFMGSLAVTMKGIAARLK